MAPKDGDTIHISCGRDCRQISRSVPVRLFVANSIGSCALPPAFWVLEWIEQIVMNNSERGSSVLPASSLIMLLCFMLERTSCSLFFATCGAWPVTSEFSITLAGMSVDLSHWGTLSQSVILVLQFTQMIQWLCLCGVPELLSTDSDE
jgi:hypothetical protein